MLQLLNLVYRTDLKLFSTLPQKKIILNLLCVFGFELCLCEQVFSYRFNNCVEIFRDVQTLFKENYLISRAL